MFQVIHSNSMHRLADRFIEQTGIAPLGPFDQQMVVVQSFGMGQWLKLRQAEQIGIAANLNCILPANLIWNLYRELLPDLDLPSTSPYAIEYLTWHLIRYFPDCQRDDFDEVRAFLEGTGDGQVREYQLAEKIATLFDQYLIYRSDWIDQWEQASGRPPDLSIAEVWQRQLWQRLSQDPLLASGTHRAGLHRALLRRLESSEPLPGHLPGHIAVMGLSALPPMHLQTLQAYSRKAEVDLYFLNPSEHYWGDIVSEQNQAKRSIRRLLSKASLAADDYLETGNPLLSSWGRQGREFLEQLLETPDVAEVDDFDPPTPGKLLNDVKRDIFDLSFGTEFGQNVAPGKKPVAATDISIQIHSCHSRMREIEVLYDQLMRMFDESPELRPADVIVMTPDVSAYAPFAQAVFKQHGLPISIADRTTAGQSPILIALLSLLALPDARVTGTEVMDLLEIPAVSRRFGLDDSELMVIGRWIETSGIRWEIDESTREQHWQLPRQRHNTWRFGLDRLLLGITMESEAGTCQDILPLDVDTGQAELLGTLCEIIDLIDRYREALSDSHVSRGWRELVSDIIEDFFEPDQQEEQDLVQVRELLIRLETEHEETGFDQALTPKMFRYWLDRQLSVATQSRGFISGSITFATLVPMRSVPFRVVCLLGMNDGEYPRTDRPQDFDLMAAAHRRGDRSKRDDDRYLFLEALLSADEYFYISYIGRGIRDNQEQPPSVLVSELVSYLDRTFEHSAVTEHPLQPFSDAYYQPEGHPNLVTYRSEWYDALRSHSPPAPFTDSPLANHPELDLVSLEQLRRFFRAPAQSFLRLRLGVYFEDRDIELDDVEPFELGGLEQYALVQRCLDGLETGIPVGRIREEALAGGMVIPGEPGERALNQALLRASAIHERVRDMAIEEAIVFDGECVLNQGTDAERRISGTVVGLVNDRVINFRAATLRKRQLLEAWINHLFVNALRGETPTSLVSLRNDKVLEQELLPISPAAALAQLSAFALLYDQGLRHPLPLIPETSGRYLEAVKKHGDHAAARKAATAIWHQEFGFSESQDPCYARLFDIPRDIDEEFIEVASQVFGPLLEQLK